MSLNVQFVTLWMMAGSGAFLGMLFDVYRVLAGQFRPPRWLVPVLDVVYWMAGTVFVFRALLYSNYGQVRFYVFIGLIFGVWIYFALASRFTTKIVLFAIRIVKWTIRFIRRTIELVIVKPIVLAYKLIVVLLGFLSALSIFLLKVVLQLLYPFLLLGRAIARPLIKRWRTPVWWSRFAGFIGKRFQAVRRFFKRDGNDKS